MKATTRIIILVLVLFSGVGCDQATKYIAADKLSAHQPAQNYLGGMFKLTYAENRGAFLSLGAGLSDKQRQIFLHMIPAALLIGMFLFIIRKSFQDEPGLFLQLLALSLVLSGGIGNLIDRIGQGFVVDFMLIDTGFARTGIFNVADMLIVIGTVLLFYAAIANALRQRKIESAAE